MGSDESSGARPAGPVALRIKLRYDDVESMVQRFACNVGRAGLFLPTRSLQPIGTEVKFELRIANDTPVLVGLGRVKSVKAPDPANPKAAFGMAIELMRVTREAREIIIRLIERRRQLGLPEVGIPMPEDVEAARRMDVDTQPVGLMTAPRTAAPAIAALAPEPARAKRPKPAELVALARGSSEGIGGADDDGERVDVGKVLARARALAGGDADAELDAIKEASAAPLEISVEAASAELARQLGGVAIARKERSAGWAPPPVVVQPPAPTPEQAALLAAVVEAKLDEAPIVEAKPEPEPIVEAAPAPEPEPAPSFDAIAEAPEAIAEAPEPVAALSPPPREPLFGTEDAHSLKTDPALAGLAHHRALEAHDDEVDSFADALDAARIQTGVSRPAPPPPDDEIPELDNLDLQPDEELFGENTHIGAMPAPSAAPAGEPAFDEAPVGDEGDAAAEEEEEIDELDVLAEADADDDDLLVSNGERDSASYTAVSPEQLMSDPSFTGPPVFPSDDDGNLYTPPPREAPRDESRDESFDEPHAHFRDARTRIEPAPHDDFADRLALDDDDGGLAYHAARRMPLPPPSLPPQRDSDLENALSKLAVDLDHFQAQPEDEGIDTGDAPHDRPAPRDRRRRLPGMPPANGWPEVVTPTPRPARLLPADDDGIIVEFDDDDDPKA